MTATRAARLTGAALAGALALVTVGWMLRDLALADGSLADLLGHWTGDRRPALRDRVATFALDPVLFLLYTGTAVAALRSPAALSALATAGAVTVGVRLPGLWTASGGIALVTTLLLLALGGALLLTAAAGRRPVRSAHEPAPARPRTRPAVIAAVLLALAALLRVAQEIRLVRDFPTELVVGRYTGGRFAPAPLLAPPPGWLVAALVLLLLTAAAGAIARPPGSRPLGVAAGALMAGWGLTVLATVLRHDTLGALAGPEAAEPLTLASALFDLAGGVAVLVALAGRGEPHPAGTVPLPSRPPAPPSPRPRGW
ncbi:hypothetical protein [Streptomyces sp. NBC_01216]|uniref:hypothetical protein n=1 Tax=unclassified Streptomyces TaxID=2593676 RepID=UPI002E0E16C7|nr:hypothetical protein OG393_10295 [Streptomyces sp. NBC_01216]